MRHFSDRIGMRQYFYFLHKFFRIISQKQLGQLIWKLIWIGCYLLKTTGLDLDLHNFCSIQKTQLTLLGATLIFGFSHNTLLSDQEKLDLIVLQTDLQIIQENLHTFQREHQPKTFVALRQFWPLREWRVGGLIEFIKEGQFMTKIVFPDNFEESSNNL